jgi:NADH dehydrogenase FAD-containing subunit
VPFDVVIAGGGFGGLYAARRLERRLPRHSARLTVVSDVNFLLYAPLLPGAAAGTLEPRHVVVPLREELEWAELLLGRVTGADPGVNELYVRTLDERDETLRYDQPRCRIAGTRWVLVEAQDRIMREIPASLAEVAARELRRRGMELRTGTTLESMDERSAVLSTGERLSTRLVCWTAGVRTPGVVRQLGLPLTRGDRIETDATMRVKGWDKVWAIGDAAAVPDPAQRRKAPAPQTCQHAIREGRVVGSNVAAVLAGRKPRPLRYRTLGVFVDMGRNKAVATVLGLRLRGFPAWFAARTYHLAMMPGIARRVRLGIDWAVGLVFGRASAELGQLGHPPSLGDYLDEAARAGETPDR